MTMSTEFINDILHWGENLKGFKREHAAAALHGGELIINGHPSNGRMISGLGIKDRSACLCLLLEFSLGFWMDDCFDQDILDETQLQILENILLQKKIVVPAELLACQTLRKIQLRSIRSQCDYSLMLQSDIEYFHALCREKLPSQKLSYAEYLENGRVSIAVMNVFTAISAFWDLGLSARLSDPNFVTMIKNFGYMQRLQNDLASWHKEQREKNNINAIKIMTHIMDETTALTFVNRESMGYQNIVQNNLKSLAVDDPWRRIAELCYLACSHFYKDNARYT